MSTEKSENLTESDKTQSTASHVTSVEAKLEDGDDKKGNKTICANNSLLSSPFTRLRRNSTGKFTVNPSVQDANILACHVLEADY
jgi:hypothetical protein